MKLKQKTLVILCAIVMLLVSNLFAAVRYARTDAGWVSENFWFSFRIGLALMVLALIHLIRGKG